MEAHVDGFGVLGLDFVVYKAYCEGVVDQNGCTGCRLWVSERDECLNVWYGARGC